MAKATAVTAAVRQSAENPDRSLAGLIDDIRTLAGVCVQPAVWERAVVNWQPSATLGAAAIVTANWVETYNRLMALMRRMARHAWVVMHTVQGRGHAHAAIERLHRDLEHLLQNPQNGEEWVPFDIVGTLLAD